MSVSNILGEYMLKGWVLTDRTCSNDSCNVPLMRSPTGRSPVVHFCANCDQRPDAPVQRPSLQLVPTTDPSVSSTSSDSHISRTSTPPTEMSSALSSPTFALPPETAESRRRREQSDMASSEIGKRLLKGWAMLAEECPNMQCFGVPLVRPPKAGDATDPHKECVVCATRYVTDTDWTGRQTLVPVAEKESLVPPIATPLTSSQSSYTAQIPIPLPVPHRSVEASAYSAQFDTTSTTSILATLDNAAAALERSLQTLTSKLTVLSDGYSPVDPLTIGLTADAMSKTAQALTHVKQLQSSERQNFTQ